MTDETSHRRLMVFDSKSKAENMDPWPQEEIDKHIEAVNNGQKRYTGLTRAKARRGQSHSGGSRYASVADKSMRGESGSEREVVSFPKLYMGMSPSYSNKSSATSIS